VVKKQGANQKGSEFQSRTHLNSSCSNMCWRN